jgi:rhodanese-related sulfurtransferase
LAQKSNEITQEDLAGILFDSLRNKIMPLPNETTVYPAHGAGSACGKNMMKETVDTLGNQKQMNYALRADMTKDEFIKEVTDGLLPPPAYFPLNVAMNKKGYKSIDKILESGVQALNPAEFEQTANTTGALVLDVRTQEAFVESHIPSSIFIGLDGSFAPWVGELIVDVQQPILLVVGSGQAEEAVTRLARVGFDNTIGFLNGGVDAWQKAGKQIDSIKSIPATQFAKEIKTNELEIVDVRKDGEFDAEHVEYALHLSLGTINQHLDALP